MFFSKNQLPALITDIAQSKGSNVYVTGYVSQQGTYRRRPWIGKLLDRSGSSGQISLIYKFLEIPQGAYVSEFVSGDFSLIGTLFGVMYYYNSRDFIELLLAQPIRRRDVFLDNGWVLAFHSAQAL